VEQGGEKSDQDMNKSDEDSEKEKGSAGSDTSKGTDGGEGESEIELDSDILNEISEGSSSDISVNHVGESEILRGDTRWRRKRRLKVSDTVTTLVMALWILRFPVLNIDIEVYVCSITSG